MNKQIDSKQVTKTTSKQNTSKQPANKKTSREYLTAITIVGGIITLIEPDGSIGYYRQRGMTRANQVDLENLTKRGIIQSNWRNFKELPPHYSIAYEDTEIMGRAVATFSLK